MFISEILSARACFIFIYHPLKSYHAFLDAHLLEPAINGSNSKPISSVSGDYLVLF